ncbi:MAG: recombinase, partial [Oscillospiraceae bacterium]|nr:recombinase [Oscillospiraceae bacterium]
SHSKKWPRFKDEKGAWINSYSLLQDRFHEHMKAAGFTDFERGERGSTTEHLTTLEYKTKQEAERAAVFAAIVGERQETAAALAEQTEKRQGQLAALDKKLAVSKQAAVTVDEVQGMARKTMGGNVQLSPADWETVFGLAKEGVKSRATIKRLREKIAALSREVADLKQQLARYGEGLGITDTMQYYQAKQRAPRRMAGVIADIQRQPPEQQAPDKTATRKKQQEQSL